MSLLQSDLCPALQKAHSQHEAAWRKQPQAQLTLQEKCGWHSKKWEAQRSADQIEPKWYEEEKIACTPFWQDFALALPNSEFYLGIGSFGGTPVQQYSDTNDTKDFAPSAVPQSGPTSSRC